MSRNISEPSRAKSALAAFTLFTRFPFWRLARIPQECWAEAVAFWPLVGWLTGGIAAGVLLAFSFVFPPVVAAVAALAARTLATGALHEDGLADFCDAFGCGGGRERILAVMKDSHIGTYGVISLVVWYLMASALLGSLGAGQASLLIFAADPFAKLCAGQLPNLLPYARPEGAKNRISYSRLGAPSLALQILFGILPAALFVAMAGVWTVLGFIPVVGMMWGLVAMMRRGIGGYTGDCCGASFLICELTLLITLSALLRLPL